MSGSNWRYVLAAVGWLILAAAVPTNNETTADERNSAADVSHPLDSIEEAQNKIADNNSPSEYQRPCNATEHNNKSDLCAQWYAANAARDAADWSFWSVIVGGLSALGLIVTLAFNYLAWRQGSEGREDTRRAIREARRSNLISIVSEKRARRTASAGDADTKAALQSAKDSAAAAAELARISENTAERSLRPYVGTLRPFFHMPGGDVLPHAVIHIKNFGQTPAKRVIYRNSIRFDRLVPDDRGYSAGGDLGIIDPSDEKDAVMHITDNITREIILEKFNKYGLILIFCIRIDYLDFLGRQYWREVIHSLDIKMMVGQPPWRLMRWDGGNDGD